LFAARYLFVQRHLNKTERKTLWRVSRGVPQLRVLRAIIELDCCVLLFLRSM